MGKVPEDQWSEQKRGERQGAQKQRGTVRGRIISVQNRSVHLEDGSVEGASGEGSGGWWEC